MEGKQMATTEFQEWLQQRLVGDGRSVRDIATDIGVSHVNMQSLAAGRSKPHPPTVIKLAEYFQVDVDLLYDLLGWKRSKQRYTLLPEWQKELQTIEAMSAADQRLLLKVVRAAWKVRTRDESDD
jgi:transcriptional regulator with XRE-family HTH domain